MDDHSPIEMIGKQKSLDANHLELQSKVEEL